MASVADTSAFTEPIGPPSQAPTLTATAASSSQIRLAWTAVAGAAGYRLFRGSTLAYSGQGLSFTDGGLTAGAQYCYTVRAFNSSGDGPLSNQACAFTTQGPPTAAPSLTATATSSSQIALSWATVAGATGYRLYRGSSQIYSGPATSFTDNGLAAGTQYCYTVRASNGAGDGPLSNQACATTAGAGPGQVQNLRVWNVTHQSISLAWDAVTGAESYDVLRWGTVIGNWSGTTYNNIGLSPNTQYCYTVRARAGTVMGPESAQVCATTLAAP